MDKVKWYSNVAYKQICQYVDVPYSALVLLLLYR